jgi:hypothetical protein
VERESQPDLERIRRLASELAAADPGPAGALAAELAEALAGLSARIDALWELISAIVAAAGLGGPAETADPGHAGADPAQAYPDHAYPAQPDLTQAVSAQADFARAMASARLTGQRGLRLSIDGREWVAALSQQAPGHQTPGNQAAGNQAAGNQAAGNQAAGHQIPGQRAPSQQEPARPAPGRQRAGADRAAWSAIERLARESSRQDDTRDRDGVLDSDNVLDHDDCLDRDAAPDQDDR